MGYALGYIFGGLVGQALGWRAAFWLEGACMAPFALFCLLAPPVDIRSSGSPGGGGRPGLCASSWLSCLRGWSNRALCTVALALHAGVSLHLCSVALLDRVCGMRHRCTSSL